MGFDKKVREDALVASARRCCVCREFKGVKIEVHHIIPKEQRGTDDFDNAIPLCFDCHSDAGHYHSKHPKGTKFSPDELRKHRDAWYEIVKEGKSLSNQLSTENLICQYVITSDREVVIDIMNNNIKIAYFNEILYYQPKGFESVIDYFLSKKSHVFYGHDYYESVEEYLTAHPDAQKIDDDISHDLYYRPFTDDELEGFNDYNFLELRKNGYSVDQIVQRRFTEDCGGFHEDIRTTNLYMCFLSIYNVTDNFIQLDKIEYSTQLNSDIKEMNLPPVMIQPKGTVFMPLAVMIKPLNIILNPVYTEESYPEEVLRQDYSRVEIINSFKKDMLPIKQSISPSSIRYFMNSEALYNEVHTLDTNNLYRISRELEIGSCPYIFFIDCENRLKFWGEIFNKHYGEGGIERVNIPEYAKKIIIAELEHETTYIESICIDNDKVFDSVELNKGDKIVFDIKSNKVLSISGFYKSKVDPSTTQYRIDKNEILKSFEYNYYNNGIADHNVSLNIMAKTID